MSVLPESERKTAKIDKKRKEISLTDNGKSGIIISGENGKHL